MTNLGWAIIGWAMLALGAAWVIYSLIRWPTRAARCPKCRYDMSGVQPTADGFMCTECGRVTRQARRLHRRPRRKRLAMLALVLAIPASQMVMLSRRPDTQWTRWVPTSVLVILAGKFDFGPCFDTPGPRAYMHLALVQRFERMWDWQRQLWLPREVVDQIREAEKAYLVREVWPEGERVVVHEAVGGRSRKLFAGRVVPQASIWIAGNRATDVIQANQLSPTKQPRRTLVSERAAPIEIAVQCEVFWAHSLSTPPGDPLLRSLLDSDFRFFSARRVALPPGTTARIAHTLSLPTRLVTPPIRFVATLDEAIEPVRDDPMLDDAIRQTLSYRLVPDPRDWPNASPNLMLPDLSQVAIVSWPEDVGLRGHTRLRGPQGEAILHPQYEYDTGRYMGFPISFPTQQGHLAFRAALARFASGDDSAWDGWTLIVEGDGRAVLRETLAPKYWAGRLEIPFRPTR